MAKIPNCGGCKCVQTFIHENDPDDLFGNNGDYWINCTTTNVFRKVNDVWELLCNLVDDVACNCTSQDVIGYQYADRTDEFATTSDVFLEYMSLTTPVLEAGLYRIGWRLQYEISNNSTTAEYQITIDDVTNLDTEVLTSSPSGGDRDFGNFEEVNLAAGVHDIDIDFRRASGAGTVTIDDAKIEIWRVG